MRRYTVTEAAAKLERHPELIRRWLRSGRLRGEKFARDWVIPQREIDRLVRSAPQRRRR